jgi:hypothetical protein
MIDKLLYALSRDPAGIQLVIHPDRATFEFRYGCIYLTADSLEQVLLLAESYVITHGGHPAVVEALKALQPLVPPETLQLMIEAAFHE